MQTGTITITKKTKDFKSSISEKTQSGKKSASHHQDLDNFCYRGDDCEQANQGQQIAGEDNDAAGFKDQSENLAVSTTTAGAGIGNSTGNGTELEMELAEHLNRNVNFVWQMLN